MGREGLTRGDTAVYRAAGRCAKALGTAFSALERALDYRASAAGQHRRSVAQDYAGPLRWLSNYILGEKSELEVPRGSSYHDHWLTSIDSTLVPEVCAYEGLEPCAQLEPDFRAKHSRAARELLEKGMKFSATERPAYAGPNGLFCMIGNATVSLREGTLHTEDVFDFEQVRDPVVVPGPLKPVVYAAMAISPALRRHVSKDGRRMLIADSYFSCMDGNKFTTRIEGPVAGLRRFGWDL